VFFNGADVAKSDECLALIDDTAKRLGSVDILVNNAGIQHVASIESFPPEEWDRIIATNLSAVFHTSRISLPLMRKSGWGRIVNIASTHGLVGSIGKAAYVAAKHGVIGLTKVVALEAAGSGITCNSICPGWVLTPLVRNQIEERARARGLSVQSAERELLVEKHPTGVFTTIDQIGDLCVFLCTAAADNITGTSIPVDGGWLAQ
jgi:3-hydroxybutyrate dehydrogenase